jgi:hypothetical protein
VFEEGVAEDCIETMVLKWKLINACLAKFDIETFAFSLLSRFCKLRVLNIDSGDESRGYSSCQPKRDRAGAAAGVKHRPARY